MITEDKELLFQDLSARLPWGVIVKTPYNNAKLIGIVTRKGYTKETKYIDVITDKQTYPIRYVTPYLRSMNRMTDKEKEEIKSLFLYVWADDNKRLLVVRQNKMAEYLSYLYSHYFDFHGLIEKDLAIEAPEGMYNI